MKVKLLAPLALAAALGFGWAGYAVGAGSEPSAASIALAKEIIALKGGNLMFDPIVPGVVESVKNVFVPTNPQLTKELNEVSVQLRKEFEPKHAELLNMVATTYAKHFTEQELKDLDAFYKTPLGKKVIAEEAKALDESLKAAQTWADNLSDVVMNRMRAEMKKRGHDL
ncbi:MAG TPA: DUF2059 domain-containing protein [Xanthobacteraceae bacterium]|jgi:hypothetical protein|nr:DUF2059 domain-containing protein [Xanthobacteraceae bacterium]